MRWKQYFVETRCIASLGSTKSGFKETVDANDGVCGHRVGIREIEPVRFPRIGHEFGLGSN